jgi:N-acetylmuramoyl-L-alanine amidase
MRIVSHAIADATFKAAQSAGGQLVKPTLIIVHDTAGRLDKGSSVSWFCSPACNTSAHVVVELDGSITQMVRFNTVAFHAGRSEWKGRSGCNQFSIGIEIVNPGALDHNGRAWFHKATEKGFSPALLNRVHTIAHGDAWWMRYTSAQIQAVTELCKALVHAYPTITEIVGHYHVSPGRKVDVNPLFPMEQVRTAVFSADPLPAPTVPETPPVVATVAKPVVAALKSANESRSIWAVLWGLVTLICGYITDYAQQGWDWLTWAIDLVPKVKQEVDDVVSPAAEMATWFGANIGNIALTISAICVCVFVWRHLQLRMQVAPTPAPEEDTA